MSKNTVAVKTHGYSYVDEHKTDVKGAILLVIIHCIIRTFFFVAFTRLNLLRSGIHLTQWKPNSIEKSLGCPLFRKLWILENCEHPKIGTRRRRKSHCDGTTWSLQLDRMGKFLLTSDKTLGQTASTVCCKKTWKYSSQSRLLWKFEGEYKVCPVD